MNLDIPSSQTDKKRPHLDQCVECTNGKPDNGLIVDAGPTLMYCKCNPGTGAGQADWPTAIFDLSQFTP
jgi:hypothetical protein